MRVNPWKIWSIMSQSAKSKAVPLRFAADVQVLSWYSWARALPVLALVYVCTNVWGMLGAALFLGLGWTYWVWRHNHCFVLDEQVLFIERPFWGQDPVYRVALDQLASVHIRLGQGLDQRQWLDLYQPDGSHTRWRCDALHEQDPPDADDHHHAHDLPEHELFALLEEEDFYWGSLQHLAACLYQQGVPNVSFLTD